MKEDCIDGGGSGGGVREGCGYTGTYREEFDAYYSDAVSVVEVPQGA